MENKKKIWVTVITIILILILIGMVINRALKKIDEEDTFEVIEETNRDTIVGKQPEKVSGYHLVTYDQSANTNSFIKSLQVEVASEGSVKFAIGSINEDLLVEERISFELDCQYGNNTFNLLDKRYLVKENEYLFMDLNGQDTLYREEGIETKSLVQNENNRILGQMLVTKSDYVLPFSYTLEETQEYNCLFIGNEITTNNNVQGLHATDIEHDYYAITKTRLEKIFEKTNINRVNLSAWEKSLDTQVNRQILDNDVLKNLDLVVIQLGENFSSSADFEVKMENLIEYIREYSLNPEIIWISGWNVQEGILNQIPVVCEKEEIEYMNISDLYEENYQSRVTESSVNSMQEVFYYPNNEAMQVISNRIMEVLQFHNF